jgi:hypothetical protein
MLTLATEGAQEERRLMTQRGGTIRRLWGAIALVLIMVSVPGPARAQAAGTAGGPRRTGG